MVNCLGEMVNFLERNGQFFLERNGQFGGGSIFFFGGGVNFLEKMVNFLRKSGQFSWAEKLPILDGILALEERGRNCLVFEK